MGRQDFTGRTAEKELVAEERFAGPVAPRRAMGVLPGDSG